MTSMRKIMEEFSLIPSTSAHKGRPEDRDSVRCWDALVLSQRASGDHSIRGPRLDLKRAMVRITKKGRE